MIKLQLQNSEIKVTAIAIMMLLLVFSCKPREAAENEPELFTLMSPEVTHVDFVNHLTENERINMVKYLYFNNGAGVAAGDINNDGLTDLYFTSNQNPNRLYLNKGNLIFEDITEKAGVAGTGDWKTGVTMADVNGDGFLDIYVCQVGNYRGLHGKNQLFINNRDLTFKDEAHEYGLDFTGYSVQAAFFDYDTDGDLDMYLLNHSVHTVRSYGDVSLRFQHDSLAGDRLYRNDDLKGKPIFRDVTLKAGIYNSQIGYGLGVNISDFNNDGYPDIYISNDFHENDYLYINNCNGTFTNRMEEFIKHTTKSSMGNDAGDINNDGLIDIVVLDMIPEEEVIRKQAAGDDDYELFSLKVKHGFGHQYVRNMLQLNLGGGMFSEIGLLAGIYSTDWSWSPLLCDVDNDGWKDLHITNGIYRRANELNYIRYMESNNFFEGISEIDAPDSVIYKKMPLYPYYNYIYQNNHDYTFTNKARVWGFNTRSYSNGASYADLDNDGDLDLITNNINDNAFIYRNNSETILRNNFLNVVLKGKGMNKRGIGTRVTIYAGGQIQIAEQFPTRGFSSAVSDILHFGLGPADIIDSLIVRWPDLSEQVIKNVHAGRAITLDIKDAGRPFRIRDEYDEAKRLFSQTQVPGLEFRHSENQIVDFQREQLIPHSLFNEGPALAAGDLNGDGLDDIFAGGAKGQESAIFIQQPGGSFKNLYLPLFKKEINSEDVDAAIFDADGDGDNDIYIVRGGNDVSIGTPLLDDKLLINNGQEVFREAEKGSLPYTANNGSCVRPCDFDNDGDIDLFVGSRSIPGAYGLSPNQLLLENDGKGRFTDVTDIRMKRVKKIGMITDASWMDYDMDGDHDLIVAGEWTKVYVLKNDKGVFSDETRAAGLENTSGWWTALCSADIDRDGDPDLIGGNLGLNSKLKASVNEPVDMYINDFDNNGILDHVICTYREGISYPVAYLDDMTGQMPYLEKKFPEYSDFAGKTAKDIFGSKNLRRSILLRAVFFESCIFRNEGNGKFKMTSLPIEAQFAPVRDILVQDFNRDNKTDIVVAGNDYTVRPSLGRFDASYGWFLSGDDNLKFRAVMPVKSGLTVNGDARKIVPVIIGGKPCLVAAINNESIQVFGISTPF